MATYGKIGSNVKSRWTGLDGIVNKLNAKIAKIEGVSQAGLTAAGLYIKSKAVPITPIQYGNLRGSCYVISARGMRNDEGWRTFKGPQASRIQAVHAATIAAAKTAVQSRNRPTVEIGFGAFYALIVHEAMWQSHKTGQAKFLQIALSNRRQIVKIVKEYSTKAIG